MALISSCCCSLQAGFERILTMSENPLEMERCNQLEELQWLQRKHQDLISLVEELSSVFTFVLLVIIARVVSWGSILAFTLLRLNLQSSFIWIHITIGSCATIFDSFVLYTLANTMSQMLQHTRVILGQTFGQELLIQRSIEFFGLHLSYQDTQVNVFGVFIINHRLVFVSLTAILVHVISLVQWDMVNKLSLEGPQITIL
ncbi:putative gustatory receptor 85a [Drosophila willistoni]|uniref:putative gustatory receptor 85a n=1 Tax=Drosophila willistoni TaxID=7260 RepID=UPI001F07AF4A|nr:putative gustatory receptor 85a [Drosophila willistoni]